MSTVEVVGAVCASASAPTLNGASSTINANGADSKKNSHSEVIANHANAGDIQHRTSHDDAKCDHHAAMAFDQTTGTCA